MKQISCSKCNALIVIDAQYNPISCPCSQQTTISARALAYIRCVWSAKVYYLSSLPYLLVFGMAIVWCAILSIGAIQLILEKI